MFVSPFSPCLLPNASIRRVAGKAHNLGRRKVNILGHYKKELYFFSDSFKFFLLKLLDVHAISFGCLSAICFANDFDVIASRIG